MKTDKLITENQLVGDGRGFAALEDLFETPSGDRYGVIKTEWQPCRRPSERHRPFKWKFLQEVGK